MTSPTATDGTRAGPVPAGEVAGGGNGGEPGASFPFISVCLLDERGLATCYGTARSLRTRRSRHFREFRETHVCRSAVHRGVLAHLSWNGDPEGGIPAHAAEE